MQEGKFSRTAYAVALRRAAHQLFDHPKVLDDPLALRIVGVQAAEQLRGKAGEAQGRFSRAIRAFMAARSRYAEGQLALAVSRGVKQYVVLGAGLDTSAYRSPHTDLRIFEVDHPATQAWKRERLHAAGIAIPELLTFVPVNFEKQTLAEGLSQSGFDLNAPAFFSWLGVTPYLTREACMATFSFIAKLPAGSGVAFDFAVHRDLLNFKQKFALHLIAKRVAAAGEPFQLFFNPKELAADLCQLGFTQVETLDGQQINARYFQDRSDGLRVGGGLGQLMSAWV
jgi:methyltransferase (TIGR00027 family)